MAEIKDSHHVFIAGTTGSGKTFLAKTYLAGSDKPVFVLDTKRTFEWEQIPDKQLIICNRLEQIPNATANYKYIIYRPEFDEQTQEFFNSFFKYCFQLRNCTVYVDEAMQVCPNPYKMPEYYKAILTQGRELNVNVWSASQRPSNIPVLIMSESAHWFIFRLNAPADRKKLIDYTGYDEFDEILPQYVFLYYDTNSIKMPVKGRLSVKK